jgi:predicted nuclease of predicted toxin-antitoxin system
MRFLADMGVSLRVVAWLRDAGHDVVHLRDRGLAQLPDDQIFQLAISEQRIVITFDLDFREIIANSAGAIVSVVLFRVHNTRVETITRRLQVVLEQATGHLEAGAIVVVEESRLRIRMAPWGPQ